MRRLLRRILALLVLLAIVGGAVFFADRPGQVEIVWQGWQIDTSVGVLVAAVASLVLVVSLLVLLVAGLRRVPRNLRRRRALRRQRAADRAVTRGLVALVAGQSAEALVQARRAEILGGPKPVTLLLAAEAATREGDIAAAERAYLELRGRPDSEFLGLRGLLGQALRAGSDETALRLAEQARRLRPDAHWLAETLLVLETRTGAWDAARATLATAARRGALSAERVRHHRGVVFYELSRTAERNGELRRAAGFAAKAQALAPDIAAVASHHARLLLGLGRHRAAARAIERAWRTAPHSDLARLYLDIRPQDGAVARTAALVRLGQQNPGAAESHLAIAEAALAAQLWGEARRQLDLAREAASPSAPSRRLCLLMARLEESDGGHMAAAREWLDRAIAAPPDAGYTCRHCGDMTTEWQTLCRRCGSFDTLARSLQDTPQNTGPALPISPPASPSTLMLPVANPSISTQSAPSGLAAPAQSDN